MTNLSLITFLFTTNRKQTTLPSGTTASWALGPLKGLQWPQNPSKTFKRAPSKIFSFISLYSSLWSPLWSPFTAPYIPFKGMCLPGCLAFLTALPFKK